MKTGGVYNPLGGLDKSLNELMCAIILSHLVFTLIKFPTSTGDSRIYQRFDSTVDES